MVGEESSPINARNKLCHQRILKNLKNAKSSIISLKIYGKGKGELYSHLYKAHVT